MSEAGDQILLALYYELIVLGKPPVELSYIDKNYNLAGNLEVEIEANDLLDVGMIDLDLNDNQTPVVSLTGKGRREAERLMGLGRQVRLLTSFSDGTTFSDGSRFATDVPPLPASNPEVGDSPIRLNSEAWTGVTLSTVQKQALADNINNALEALEKLNLDQHKKAQARCFLIAARELAEAPEPPVDIIQLLLKNFDRTIGIAGFLVGFASLLVSL